ncbi:hypothetical protein Tco_0736304 [Tanacetum coccineum]
MLELTLTTIGGRMISVNVRLEVTNEYVYLGDCDQPDIENMTMNEYHEYEAAKERKLWDNVRSRRSPINYDEADVDSFHRNKNVMHPLILKTLHTTPPNEDYVAPATKPILDELLENKILNVAMVDEEADPTRDLEELERLLVEDPHFTEIQVHSVITKPERFIHTQPMRPLYGIFESYKSSTKPYKVDKEMKSPSRLVGFVCFLLGLQGFNNKGMEFEFFQQPYRLMHVSGAWLILGCKETFQARLVGCYTEYDEVTYDGGYCLRKQNWSMA